MLISPLTLPANLPDLIEPCLTPVLDQIADMTFRDLQAACAMGRFDLKLPLHVEIRRAQDGRIDALRATIAERNAVGKATGSSPAFACEINIACGVSSAMQGLCHGFFEYVVSEEVDRRFKAGPRELLPLTDADLMQLQGQMAYRSVAVFPTGAEIEDLLLQDMIEREISVRKDRHSAHASIALMSRQKDLLEASRADIEEELRIARLSRPRGVIADRYQVHSSITDEELAVLNLRHDDLFARLWDMRYR